MLFKLNYLVVLYQFLYILLILSINVVYHISIYSFRIEQKFTIRRSALVMHDHSEVIGRGGYKQVIDDSHAFTPSELNVVSKIASLM
jgi:hypothetical protein